MVSIFDFVVQVPLGNENKKNSVRKHSRESCIHLKIVSYRNEV